MVNNENGYLFGSKVEQEEYVKMSCKCGWLGYRVVKSGTKNTSTAQCPMCLSSELKVIEK